MPHLVARVEHHALVARRNDGISGRIHVGNDGDFRSGTLIGYDYCKQHQLRFQRCSDCQTWRHMPRESCRNCGSFNWTWERSN
ncbi:hypothetical protein C2W62_54185, partial [Candidatus Entotheonella serta]